MRANTKVSGRMSVARMSEPCFLAVESAARITASSSAPVSERNSSEYFLPQLDHVDIVLGLVVGEWHVRIAEEAQYNPLRRSLRRTRRLWLMRRRLRPRCRVRANAG